MDQQGIAAPAPAGAVEPLDQSSRLGSRLEPIWPATTNDQATVVVVSVGRDYSG